MYYPRLDVTIPAGESEAKGDVASSYVTIDLDDSGGIDRIRRQQAFLVAMANKALSSGTLANPFRLYDFLDRATQAVAVDEDLASLKEACRPGWGDQGRRQRQRALPHDADRSGRGV